MRQIEFRKDKEVKEHELEMSRAQYQHALAMGHAQHEADVREVEAKSRAEEEKLKWSGKIQAGFTPEQVIQLECFQSHTEAQKALAASANTKIYAPLDYWNMGGGNMIRFNNVGDKIK